MTTIGVYQLKQQAGVVRRTMREGNELAITFHAKPIGVLVPHDQREQERAELERLRAEVEALRAKLGQNPEVTAA
jgi:antitoxin (DNA-binding transcriptional repressor) of toxin-antitoxin stability system